MPNREETEAESARKKDTKQKKFSFCKLKVHNAIRRSSYMF